jgi:hypothetical protein
LCEYFPDVFRFLDQVASVITSESLFAYPEMRVTQGESMIGSKEIQTDRNIKIIGEVPNRIMAAIVAKCIISPKCDVVSEACKID